MTNRCGWCLTGDHDEAHCPRIAGLKVVGEFGVIDPATADDVNDVLALRMIAWRTYAGQLRREMREAGLTPSEQTESLNPDSQYEAA